jgi:hypothetical protein
LVEVTYTEDKETFERDIFKPPHVARLLDALGPFVDGLTGRDRSAFITEAFDAFFLLRNGIKCVNDIYIQWGAALKLAAQSRERWLVWNPQEVAWLWVPAKKLGRKS